MKFKNMHNDGFATQICSNAENAQTKKKNNHVTH